VAVHRDTLKMPGRDASCDSVEKLGSWLSFGIHKLRIRDLGEATAPKTSKRCEDNKRAGHDSRYQLVKFINRILSRKVVAGRLILRHWGKRCLTLPQTPTRREQLREACHNQNDFSGV
jgi:hypothetical protein